MCWYYYLCSTALLGCPLVLLESIHALASFCTESWFETCSQILLLLILEQNLEHYPHYTTVDQENDSWMTYPMCPNRGWFTSAVANTSAYTVYMQSILSSEAPQLSLNKWEWVGHRGEFCSDNKPPPRADTENGWMCRMKCMWCFKSLTLLATRISWTRERRWSINVDFWNDFFFFLTTK